MDICKPFSVARAESCHYKAAVNLQNVCRMLKSRLPYERVYWMQEPSLYKVFDKPAEAYKVYIEVQYIPGDTLIEILTGLSYRAYELLDNFLGVICSSVSGLSVVGEKRYQVLNNLYLEWAIYVRDLKSEVLYLLQSMSSADTYNGESYSTNMEKFSTPKEDHSNNSVDPVPTSHVRLGSFTADATSRSYLETHSNCKSDCTTAMLVDLDMGSQDILDADSSVNLIDFGTDLSFVSGDVLSVDRNVCILDEVQTEEKAHNKGCLPSSFYIEANLIEFDGSISSFKSGEQQIVSNLKLLTPNTNGVTIDCQMCGNKVSPDPNNVDIGKGVYQFPSISHPLASNPYDALICWMTIVVLMLTCYCADSDKLDILKISKPKEDNYSADSKNVNSTENLSDLTEGDKAADSLKSAKDKNIHSLSYLGSDGDISKLTYAASKSRTLSFVAEQPSSQVTNLCHNKPSVVGLSLEVNSSDSFRGSEPVQTVSCKGVPRDETQNNIDSFPKSVEESTHSKRLDLMFRNSTDLSLKQEQSTSVGPMQLEPKLSSSGLPICVKAQKADGQYFGFSGFCRKYVPNCFKLWRDNSCIKRPNVAITEIPWA